MYINPFDKTRKWNEIDCQGLDLLHQHNGIRDQTWLSVKYLGQQNLDPLIIKVCIANTDRINQYFASVMVE